MFEAVLNCYTVSLFPKQQTNSTGVKGTINEKIRQ